MTFGLFDVGLFGLHMSPLTHRILKLEEVHSFAQQISIEYVLHLPSIQH